MALEIERRFLVAGEAWRPHVRWSRSLRQGYLAAGPAGVTVRVRQAAEQAWLTLKASASSDGLVRHEFEYPIPVADAAALLALAPRQLAKCRHGLDLPGGDWVLDVFEGANAPLVVAEVELADAAVLISPPAWCVQEITGRPELSNAALSAQPLAAWPELEKAALLALLQG
ncbi:MAG: CYTH domain-containing protein [Cyanobacteriota bacterium]|nr:CYTH domain-containing protein [Cyanobacteriota bacterium]